MFYYEATRFEAVHATGMPENQLLPCHGARVQIGCRGKEPTRDSIHQRFAEFAHPLGVTYVACRLRITDEPGSHAVFQASDCYVHTHRQTGRQKDERFISYVCERERERERASERERETHTHKEKCRFLQFEFLAHLTQSHTGTHVLMRRYMYVSCMHIYIHIHNSISALSQQYHFIR